jgi:hypothetical protein
VDAHGVATPFLGPGIPQEPAVLAFLVPASAMGSPDTLILLPQPGIGTVSYAASVVDPYSVVANGRSDLNGVGIVDRDPRAATDRIEVRSADGTVVFRSGVQALLCGAKSCG